MSLLVDESDEALCLYVAAEGYAQAASEFHRTVTAGCEAARTAKAAAALSEAGEKLRIAAVIYAEKTLIETGG